MAPPGPLSFVPDDILFEIFKWVCPTMLPEAWNCFGLTTVLLLAHVCRRWRHVISSPFVKYVCVERVLIGDCTKDGRHGYAWRSNIEMLIGMGKTEDVSHLVIKLDDGCLCKPQITEILNMFHGYHFRWANIRSLVFAGAGFMSFGNNPYYNPQLDPEAQIAFFQFIALFPNIGSMVHTKNMFDNVPLGLSIHNTILYPLYCWLFHHYRKQLTSVQGLYPLPPRVLSSVEYETTDLELNSKYLGYFADSPVFEASVIRKMTVYEIIGGMNWGWFKSRNGNAIVFSNMEQLTIRCVPQTHLSTKLDPTGGLVLCFPKLHSLTVGDSVPVFGDIYSLFHESPIEFLAMGEDLSDLQYVDARIVSRIKAFVLVGQQFSDTPVFLQRGAITRFYKALCRVQELCLLSNPYPLTDVDQFIYLKNLQIDLSVDEFPYLHGAIQQLPRLGVLDIVFKKHWSARKYPYTLLPGENMPAIEDAVPSTYRHGTNIIDASDLPPINTSLYYISIAHSGPEMFHRACILIRSLPNLTKVAVHESNALDILEFNRIRGRGVKTEVYG